MQFDDELLGRCARVVHGVQYGSPYELLEEVDEATSLIESFPIPNAKAQELANVLIERLKSSQDNDLNLIESILNCLCRVTERYQDVKVDCRFVDAIFEQFVDTPVAEYCVYILGNSSDETSLERLSYLVDNDNESIAVAASNAIRQILFRSDRSEK